MSLPNIVYIKSSACGVSLKLCRYGAIFSHLYLKPRQNLTHFGFGSIRPSFNNSFIIFEKGFVTVMT